MKWKLNYTGIDVCEMGDRVKLYMQRDGKTEKLTFIRVSFKSHMLGMFIGRQNYGSEYVNGGVQFFTKRFNLGIGKRGPKKLKMFYVTYSGSYSRQFESTIVVIANRIIFGFRTPKFMKNRLEKKREKELEKIFNQY